MRANLLLSTRPPPSGGGGGGGGAVTPYDLDWSLVEHSKARMVGNVVSSGINCGIGVHWTRRVKLTKLRMPFPGTVQPDVIMRVWGPDGTVRAEGTVVPSGVAGDICEVNISYTIPIDELYKRFYLTYYASGYYPYFNTVSNSTPLPTAQVPLIGGPSVVYEGFGFYYSGGNNIPNSSGTGELYPVDFVMEAP